MGIDVPGYLSEQQRKSSSELASEWAALEELYNKKLWHQLTLRLGEFIKNPALSQGDALVKLYQNFIIDFESRINPLALAEIIVVVCRQITDVNEALPFLEVLMCPWQHTTLIKCWHNIPSVVIDDMWGCKSVVYRRCWRYW